MTASDAAPRDEVSIDPAAQPFCSPVLRGLFDLALTLAGEKLQNGKPLIPFMVEQMQGASNLLKLTAGGESKTLSIEQLREQPWSSELEGYVIGWDSDIEREGERVSAVVLEGALSDELQAQQWAVPYAHDLESDELIPEGLVFVTTVPSRFAQSKPVNQSSGRPLGILLRSTTSSLAARIHSPATISRFMAPLRRYYAPDGRISAGLSLAELIPVLQSADTSKSTLRVIARTLQAMRSEGANAGGLIQRVSLNLTPQTGSSAAFFPQLVIACGDSDTKLKTEQHEGIFVFDPINFREVLWRGEEVLAPELFSESSVRISEAGLAAHTFILMQAPPDSPGIPLYRWFLSLYRELAVADAFDLLSVWAGAHCAYNELANILEVPSEQRYSDPLFASALYTTTTSAEIDAGLLDLLVRGTRIVANRQINEFLRPRAKVFGLVHDSSEIPLYTDHDWSRFIAFDRLPLLARFGVRGENPSLAAEELIDYLKQSLTRAVAVTRELELSS